jgi:hypothetical protein
MSSPPHDDSSPFVLRPVRHRHGGPAGHGLPGASPALLTFWLHSPYQGSGGVPVPFRCLDSGRVMERSWKVRD